MIFSTTIKKCSPRGVWLRGKREEGRRAGAAFGHRLTVGDTPSHQSPAAPHPEQPVPSHRPVRRNGFALCRWLYATLRDLLSNVGQPGGFFSLLRGGKPFVHRGPFFTALVIIYFPNKCGMGLSPLVGQSTRLQVHLHYYSRCGRFGVSMAGVKQIVRVGGGFRLGQRLRLGSTTP